MVVCSVEHKCVEFFRALAAPNPCLTSSIRILYLLIYLALQREWACSMAFSAVGPLRRSVTFRR